jgi:hypothetical protein
MEAGKVSKIPEEQQGHHREIADHADRGYAIEHLTLTAQRHRYVPKVVSD